MVKIENYLNLFLFLFKYKFKGIIMANRKLYVGVEIGGTNVTLAARDENTPFLEESVVAAAAELSSDKAFIEQIGELRRELLTKLDADINDIVFCGIGSTGQPTPDGKIDGSSNCSFRMTFAPQLLGKNLETFRIVNDVAVAAYGAMSYGFGAKEFKEQGSPRWDGAMTIGTGTNIQLLMNRELLCNKYGQSFEFGHIPVDSRVTGDECGCGRRGCGEAYFAGAGIANRAAKRLTELYIQFYKREGNAMLDNEKILNEVSKRFGLGGSTCDLILRVKAKEVFDAYKFSEKKDRTAAEIINRGIDALAQYLGNVMNALPAIPYIEVFGTIPEKDPWYVEQAVEVLKKTPAYWGNRDPNKPNATKFLVTNTEKLGLKEAVALAYHEAQKLGR